MTDPATDSMMRGTTDNGLLPPVPDADGAPFWQFTARGELRVQACADCGRLRFPPRPCCPACQSFAHTWRRMNGNGHIWSYVIPHPPLLPAYTERTPYAVALVELADAPGIRLVGNLVAGADSLLGPPPDTRPAIGAAVEAVFVRLTPGFVVPQWRPA
ncbi:OB-fold domain-containing protein [Streptomyces sp. NPDC049577]|uniref:Zn-ribbon domain-containing OB-fold protein n=1 Tax=Streptomyces sp. NPDC049577 TaxID=3155153 RepID=UPI003434C57D